MIHVYLIVAVTVLVLPSITETAPLLYVQQPVLLATYIMLGIGLTDMAEGFDSKPNSILVVIVLLLPSITETLP
jgi:hypothetical protein